MLGLLFPDIDNKHSLISKILIFPFHKLTKHRGFTHSLPGMMLFSIPLYIFIFDIGWFLFLDIQYI